MPLTRDFRIRIMERAQRDSGFREKLLVVHICSACPNRYSRLDPESRGGVQVWP